MVRRRGARGRERGKGSLGLKRGLASGCVAIPKLMLDPGRGEE